MHLLHGVMFTHSTNGDLIVVATMETAMVIGLSDDADRLLLWVVDHQSFLGCVDVKTAECKVVGRLGIPMKEIAIDSQGHLLGVNGLDLYEINKATGRLTLLDAYTDPADALRPTVGTSPTALVIQQRHSDGTDLPEPRSPTALAFDMARVFMGQVLHEPQNMVQLAVLDGRSLEIGALSHGTIYGRAKSHVSLIGAAGTRIYTTNSQTGQPTPISEHPGTPLMPLQQKPCPVES